MNDAQHGLVVIHRQDSCHASLRILPSRPAADRANEYKSGRSPVKQSKPAPLFVRRLLGGLGLGGVAILVVERVHPAPRHRGLDALRWQEALVVGLFQCLALWPGVSRSAATILGGMLVAVDRKTAAEYSFLAAIPVITAAATLELVTSLDSLNVSDLPLFATGLVVSFLAAWGAIRFFLRLLGTITLRPFGWYRITAALALLVFFY